MRNRGKKDIAHWLLGWGYLVLGLVSIVAGVFAQIPDTSPLMRSGDFGDFIRWYRPYAPLLLLFLPPLLWLIQVVRRNFGSPAVWDALQAELNDIEERVFTQHGLRRDEHSVTLFRVTRFSPCGSWFKPWQEWLVPVVRSGNARQKSWRSWRVADSGGGASRGVAGQCYSSETVINVHGLPDVLTSRTDKDRERYAELTFVTRKWLDKWIAKKQRCGQKMPLAICAYHVERKKGKPWGVLVLDSCNPDDLKAKSKDLHDVVKNHLSRLVQMV